MGSWWSVLVLSGLFVGAIAAPAAACADLWGLAVGTATDTITGDVWSVEVHRSWSGFNGDRMSIEFYEPTTGRSFETPYLTGQYERRVTAFAPLPWCTAPVETMEFRSFGPGTTPGQGVIPQGLVYELAGTMYHCFGNVLDDRDIIRGHLTGHWMHFDLDVTVG